MIEEREACVSQSRHGLIPVAPVKLLILLFFLHF